MHRESECWMVAGLSWASSLTSIEWSDSRLAWLASGRTVIGRRRRRLIVGGVNSRMVWTRARETERDCYLVVFVKQNWRVLSTTNELMTSAAIVNNRMLRNYTHTQHINQSINHQHWHSTINPTTTNSRTANQAYFVGDKEPTDTVLVLSDVRNWQCYSLVVCCQVTTASLPGLGLVTSQRAEECSAWNH